MELEKSETDVLGSLYALRGGLSAISAEYDNVRRIDADFYEKLNCIADQAGGARDEAPKGTVEYGCWLVDGNFERLVKSRYDSISEQYISDDKTDDWHSKISAYRRGAVKKFASMFLHLFITGLLLTGIICLVLYGSFDGETGAEAALRSTADKITLAILLLIPLATFIVSLTVMRKGINNAKSLKYAKRELLQYLNTVQQDRENEANKTRLARNEAQANIDKLPTVRNEAKKILAERNSVISVKVQSCTAFYRALSEQFNWLLDERDWQHLDLVIYQIETRRADSVKEALQLVDRELQTERIQRTIGVATQTIFNTLTCGFTRLQSSIDICCVKIGLNLCGVSDPPDYLPTQIKVQNTQLAALSDSVNVSKALMAKANVPSAQLFNEAHYAIQYK